MQQKADPNATVCPLLGLARDRWTNFQFATPDNRCWAKQRPEGIDLAFQGAICLRPDFRDCVLYRQWDKSRGAPGS